MRVNWINVLVATCIVGLLSWWLWILGIDTTQKWLLACVGGFVMEVGLLGAMGVESNRERSGIQAKIVFLLMMIATFIASFIFSYFNFSPQSYCIPIGVFCLICTFLGIKTYQSKE